MDDGTYEERTFFSQQPTLHEYDHSTEKVNSLSMLIEHEEKYNVLERNDRYQEQPRVFEPVGFAVNHPGNLFPIFNRIKLTELQPKNPVSQNQNQNPNQRFQSSTAA